MESPTTPAVTCSVSGVDTGCRYVFLGTALVDVISANGEKVKVRAMIDCCSQASYVTESCVERLGLTIKPSFVPALGLAATAVNSAKGIVNLRIHDQKLKENLLSVETIVLPKITVDQPCVPISRKLKKRYKHLDLADPDFTKPSEVDVLLGGEVFDQIVTGEREKRIPGLPTPWKTVFGWVIMGTWSPKEITCLNSSTLTSLVTNVELNHNLQSFWEIEEMPSAKAESPDDLIAEEMYSTLHYRESNGRYVVPILAKPGIECLGHSKEIATSRLKSLQMRLGRDAALKTEYTSFINEYMNLEHMTKARKSGSYFIPHHPVVRSDARGMKLRVVFNGSSVTSSGTSLNDWLHSGAKLQKDITDVLTGFRLHKIAIISDVRHMYRMINIRPEDRQWQHILWASERSSDIEEYQLNTVTYGLASSPYLALRTMQQLVADEGHRYPTAAEVLSKQLYVDDILTGANSIDDAKELIEELKSMLGKGRFSLHKWVSNYAEIFLDMNATETSNVSIEAKDNSTVKILGVHWCPLSDSFSYYVKDVSPYVNTKRAVLSNIARIFDPLGWISPVTVWAKQLLQNLWKLQIGWDDCLPEHELNEWRRFVTDLPALSSFVLPRFVVSKETSNIHLIGFCDASSKAYGAVVYLRIGDEYSHGECHLLMAKTKVAPVKPVTIPRLELMGAVVLTNLLNHLYHVLSERDVKIQSVRAFTDSSVVLSWIATPVYLLTTFVCHRVAKIVDCNLEISWNHVSTHENPADIASKGAFPSQLLLHPMWMKGPPWMTQPMSHWPSRSDIILPQDELPEIKKRSVTVLVATIAPDISFIESFSTLSKLQRVIAYILRWRIKKDKRATGELTSRELQTALLQLIKGTQFAYFSKEIKLLMNGENCTTQLLSLNPFVDHKGLLRVGGRLRNSAELTYHEKYPLILPKSCHITNLLIDYYHKVHLHAGANTLHYLLRSRYWILSARVRIRSRLHKCLVCRKLSASNSPPKMGDLPSARVNFTRPFLHCGIDFGGPFYIKESSRRNARTRKAYLALFVCLAVKAIHLEIVSDLTTEAFLAALDRFTARRGLCSDIYSDGGRTFVGADRCLKDLVVIMKSESTLKEFSKREITWHFNPPYSPNFGGLWEAGIKSAKCHLKRVIGCQSLTFEELSTLFARVEAVLNSRPLVGVQNTSADDIVLSPSHFLIGSSLCVPPEPSLLDIQERYLKRWQLVQKMRQDFAKRWVREYLNTLQQRHKWQTSNENLKVGDLVWLRGENMPPLEWPLARIVEAYPGMDSTVRVVKLKTAHGTFTRPVSKLVKLPV